MSGLAVIYNLDGVPASPAILETMTIQAQERGPHGIRYWHEGPVGFAHLSLNATPEAWHEQQPLVADEGRLALTADARIDNRPELIAALSGVLPEADVITDVQLILSAYQKWGEACAAHLIGDYAFVLWDGRRRRLLAACDPLGIRILYYARFGDTLCLASEARQVLGHPAATRRPSALGLAQFIAGVGDPSVSMFEGIHGLPGAHRIVATSHGIVRDQFWRPEPGPRLRPGRVEEHSEHLLEVLGRCVEDRLRTATGTVGTTMSGGMDSTTVTALARRQLRNSPNAICTFTYHYKTLTQCDESELARSIASHADLDLTLLDAEELSYLDDLSRSSPRLETPYRSHDSLERTMFEQLAARGGDVLLTGQGGDDIISMPEHFQIADARWRGNLRIFPKFLEYKKSNYKSFKGLLYELLILPRISPGTDRRIRRLLGREPAPRTWPPILTSSARERLSTEGRGASDFLSAHPGRPSQKWLINSLSVPGFHIGVRPVDRVAQRYGIEVRHPFLDLRLALFALHAPVEYLRRDGLNKWLLRRAAVGLLPDRIVWRREFCSLAPYYYWCIRRQRETILQILEGGRLDALGLVDMGRLRQEFTRFFRHDSEDFDVSWLMALKAESWLQSHFP